MRLFSKFALAAVFCVYLVIFAGGLVRVTGAGLGCPDWPQCFGSWIPPTSVEQIPADMDPAQFNITLAWIEYINRLVGMIVGFLIAGLAFWSILKLRKHKRIVWGAIAAALLVAFQGWHGSVVVASDLDQSIVTVHFLLALLIAGVMIFVYTQSRSLAQNEKPAANLPKDIRWWGVGLFLLSFIQILLGTEIRATVEELAISFPLLTSKERLVSVGLFNHLHLALGLTLTAAILTFGLRVRKDISAMPKLLKTGAAGAIILILIQIMLGMVFVVWELVPLVQLFHLCIASIILGMMILILSATFQIKEN